MIDLVLDDEQEAVAQTVAEACVPLSRASSADLGAAQWRELADIGVFGVGLPAECGGVGLGAAGEVIVAQAVGYAIAPMGILARLAAARSLAARGDDRLEALLGGELRPALAAPSPHGDWIAVDVDDADCIVAVDSDVVVDAADVEILDALDSLDASVTLTRIRLAVPPTNEAGNGPHALVFAAAAVGLSQKALELACDYAATRRQYGSPIGSFQAVKHRCVDMAVRHEAALAAVRFAAVRDDAGFDDPTARATAALMATEAAAVNAASAIQVFGGIGFTVEGGLQHLLHRAWLLRRLLGSPRVLTEAVLRASGA